MGVETEIGCLGCKKYIWLGSAKSMKWKGFQVGNEYAYHFFKSHSNNENCNLLYVYDDPYEDRLIPWDEESSAYDEWEEDIVSLTFWDSHSSKGLVCGYCENLLVDIDLSILQPNVDINQTILQPNILIKNKRLCFCNDECFSAYLKKSKEKGYKIYDSIKEARVYNSFQMIEMGCTKCKRYWIIDNTKDKSGEVKNHEYLAFILGDHSFKSNCNLIVFTEGQNQDKIPWKNKLTKELWKEERI